jgi:hypothetical protein
VASIASGRASIAIPLPPGGQVDVGDDADGTADIAVTDEGGAGACDLAARRRTDGEIRSLVALLEDGEWTLEPYQDGERAVERPCWFEDQPSDEQGEESAADEPDADLGADPESDSSGNQADDPTESNDADPVDSSDSSDSSGPGSDSGGGESPVAAISVAVIPGWR